MSRYESKLNDPTAAVQPAGFCLFCISTCSGSCSGKCSGCSGGCKSSCSGGCKGGCYHSYAPGPAFP
ncbi:hypothetical protein GT678_00030 [Blautia wexlerae]|uniref:Uncharacterized protein n=1 Tax=Blautia wexlerae TaxID=418240 RepID=A0A6L8XNG4_9FIRM|nr:hypothetical protein [Blautia wexlerae]MZS94791.1 hypothetical protein [Blautia wexlerae]MZS95059.1 hypothetical protein [Blautia wexlerae]MZT02126.1 hypothetical protein [Blautia wexlerae]MZT06018.1 hypothetical protein [Blautia wexlerae]